LSVSFASDSGELNVLDEVSFNLDAGTTLGIIGESGCGKSVTALSINGLLPKRAGKITGGEYYSMMKTSLPSALRNVLHCAADALQ
jgi:peptide/nickel transport system ATP-binding protein